MIPCQRALGQPCPQPATHEILINGRQVDVYMCAQHAKAAFEEYFRQGERSVSMREMTR